MFGRYSLDEEGLVYAGGEFSDEWVVISGQCYLRRVVEYYVGKELSRVDSMAEIYGFSDSDLSACKVSSKDGNVCVVRSDEKSGSFDSFQYRRGTGKKIYQGIRELSVDRKRIEFGAGNPAYDLCSPELLDAITSGDCHELVRRGWENADRVDWKAIHYSLTTNHYAPDDDNCILISDTPYFEDDIVSRFVEFVKVVYGKDTLEENLGFIANALGNKGNTIREVIRNYFLNDFFKDHCKIYQKRPIYWLFDSGKQNGFKALVYMHRWTADTIGNVRVEYLHRIQRVYEREIEREQDTIDNSNNSRDKAAAAKRKEKLIKQLRETRDYDTLISHLALSRIDIDLDDGVKVNYEKVQTGQDGKKLAVLGKI